MGKRGTINPLWGCTDAAMMTKIRSALRKVSSATVRKQYIRSVRYRKISTKTGRMKYHVKCELCGKEMACGSRVFPLKVNGKPYKKSRSAYDVDHVNGNPPLQSLDALSTYAISLFTGKLRILCVECHKKHGMKKR